MARPLRIEFEGAFYHVISRGERKENIYNSSYDKKKFIEKLSKTVDKFTVLIHAYALMNNHYHLLLETPKGNLARVMHHINTNYSNWFKRKYKVEGSIFQGRYKSILVEKESYLKTLSAYIHLNPWRARIVKSPEDYYWSSYRSYLKKIKSPEWLYKKDILALFNADPNQYHQFIKSMMKNQEGVKKINIYGKNCFLGSEDYLKVVLQKVKGKMSEKDHREIPDIKYIRSLSVNEIKSVLLMEFNIIEKDLFRKVKGNIWRKLFIYALKNYTSLSLKEIGVIMDMDYAAVSKLGLRFEIDINNDEQLMDIVYRLEKHIRQTKFTLMSNVET